MVLRSQVDPHLYGDNLVHFEIAWVRMCAKNAICQFVLTKGGNMRNNCFLLYMQQVDNDKSCINLRCAGFVQMSKKAIPGIIIGPVSTVNGKQYIIRVKIIKVNNPLLCQ